MYAQGTIGFYIAKEQKEVFQYLKSKYKLWTFCYLKEAEKKLEQMPDEEFDKEIESLMRNRYYDHTAVR